MNKYSIETTRNIYLSCGERLEVSPDPDGLNCVEIRLKDYSSKELARITLPPEATKTLAQAILMLASELQARGS